MICRYVFSCDQGLAPSLWRTETSRFLKHNLVYLFTFNFVLPFKRNDCVKVCFYNDMRTRWLHFRRTSVKATFVFVVSFLFIHVCFWTSEIKLQLNKVCLQIFLYKTLLEINNLILLLRWEASTFELSQSRTFATWKANLEIWHWKQIGPFQGLETDASAPTMQDFLRLLSKANFFHHLRLQKDIEKKKSDWIKTLIKAPWT